MQKIPRPDLLWRPLRKSNSQQNDDEYHSTYGDVDAANQSDVEGSRLRTMQIMRLRSDQDHQAEVASRLALLTRSRGGEMSTDEATSLVERIAATEDDEAIAALLMLARGEKNPTRSFSKMYSTSELSDATSATGVGGLRRIG
jgi:hypothetical protein